jgi:ectoine hydroxylase-related dioxygenase (phytanoyl-CoA dioxygenase family)
MDPPFDDRNSLDWHQDSSYYLESEDLNNGIVCWIPMQDTNIDNGSIHLIKGSNKCGQLPFVKTDGKKNTSENLTVNLSKVDLTKEFQVNVEAGDVVFF